MDSKLKIKVIKKNGVKIYKTPEVIKESPKQDAASDIVSTVSGWVNEFRRSKETKQTFDYLFAQN